MSSKIKAVIVDDEQFGIDSLQWELNRLANVEVVQTFTKPLEAQKYILAHDVDLLFLDIQMPGMNGFELLDAIPDKNFKLIFVTAFDQFAIKAFQFSAIDYLLKPVEKEDLGRAINHYLENDRAKNSNQLSEQLDVHHAVAKGQLPERVAFATKETIEFIKPTDIMYCEAISNYTKIICKKSKLVVSKTLKDVETILAEYKFFRAHRTFIVNPKYIVRYIKTLGGSIVMEDNFEIPISRTKKEEVYKILFQK